MIMSMLSVWRSKFDLDVGVDVAYKKFGEYRPFNIGDITNIMSKRSIEKIDHHGDL
jgi:hypothetical protein